MLAPSPACCDSDTTPSYSACNPFLPGTQYAQTITVKNAATLLNLRRTVMGQQALSGGPTIPSSLWNPSFPPCPLRLIQSTFPPSPSPPGADTWRMPLCCDDENQRHLGRRLFRDIRVKVKVHPAGHQRKLVDLWTLADSTSSSTSRPSYSNPKYS